MKKYLGGYANIDLTSETIYNDLLALKDIDKTILLYDPNETKPYFIDTIVYDTNSIVLTKGGKTITIENDNDITYVGNIQGLSTLDLGNLANLADDIDDIADFDSFVIDEKIYNQLINGAYFTALLYDDVVFMGFSNFVQQTSGKTTINALVSTELRMYYYDVTDGGWCFISIGQLTDNRYYLVCSNNAIS